VTEVPCAPPRILTRRHGNGLFPASSKATDCVLGQHLVMVVRGFSSFYSCQMLHKSTKRRAAGKTLAEIAKSYAVDISMISRLT